LDIHENAHVIAYLQASEVLIRLTPKEHGWVVHRAMWFKWEDIFSYGCGRIDKYKLCSAHNNMKALCNMFMKSWIILGFVEPIICFKHNINGGNTTTCSIVCFSMCNVWSNANVIQCTYTSFTTVNHPRDWLSMEFGLCQLVNLIVWHNQYVLVMIEHFLKWLKLVPLSNYSNEGATYAFMDKVFNRFGISTTILINQSMKLCEEFSKKCVRTRSLIIIWFHETILT
jgi:hypothetical protein